MTFANTLGGTPISCSFATVSKITGVEVERHDIAVPTGSSPWRIRLRNAAQHKADDGIARCTLWAIPHLVAAEPGAWLVFAHNPGGRELQPIVQQRLPTRDAAEMWMLHHAT